MLELVLWFFDWGFIPVIGLVFIVSLYSEEIGVYLIKQLQTFKEKRPSVRPTPRWIAKLEDAVRDLEAQDPYVDKANDDLIAHLQKKLRRQKRRCKKLRRQKRRYKKLWMASRELPLVPDLVQDKVPPPETDRDEAGA